MPESEEVALCLSGGGYRAALFHLGALRRLNELGVLARIDTFSCVSGGSILGAFLAQHVRSWPERGPIADFEETIVEPFRAFTRKNIRTLWVLRRLLRPWDSTVAVESLRRRYERDVIQLSLREVDDGHRPRFLFSAADMAFGVNWVSEAAQVGSYQAGYLRPAPAGWSAARAVAASSCFPPAFAPLPIGLAPDELQGGTALKLANARPDEPARVKARLEREKLIRGLRLSDGGLYDNMGLEPVDHYGTVLVSDGGATFDFKPDGGILGRLGRYQAIQGSQVSALRKRWLLSYFKRHDEKRIRGAFWGIASDVHSYDERAAGYPGWLVHDVIAQVRTDLDYFTEPESKVLQNHGYQVADIAVRVHRPELCDPGVRCPSPPYGDEWLDEETVRRELANSHKRKLLGRWRPLHGR
ncbi:MAG: hypothetical protein QOJ97_1392 [Solirubrobacteraceae bacterium]|jgi:NTE family protein|nr:hypothetical protein [Solirubrobacteraceae bacterium]